MELRKMIKYRTSWMGLAMLWIIYFHSDLFISLQPLTWIKRFGYGGVDIFIFAAGIGSYYSYVRDHNPVNYLGRRLKRLAPVYIPFIAIWLVFTICTKGFLLGQVIGNLFGVEGISYGGTEFNWYVTGILLLYLLTPFLAGYVEKNNLIWDLILMAILAVISLAFWNDTKMIVIISRLPIYLIGMMAARYDDYLIRKRDIIVAAIANVLGIAALLYFYNHRYEDLWNKGLAWYPFILITPFICYAISWLFDSLGKIGKISALYSAVKAFTDYVGGYSFEIYLTHMFVFELFKYVLSRYGLSSRNMTWVILIVLIFPMAFILRKISILCEGICTRVAKLCSK